LAGLGKADEAIAQYQKALELKPDFAEVHNNLASLLASQGHADQAIAHYRRALEINPSFVEARNNLGLALQTQGKTEEAVAEYRKALEIAPDNARAHFNLGMVLQTQGKFVDAVAQYQKALETAPQDAVAANSLAWVLATCPEATLRNGAKAIELAERAVKRADGKSPAFCDTLAAAYAEAGRFSEAVETARKALDLATQQQEQAMVGSIQKRIALYEAKTPFRDTPALPGKPTAQRPPKGK
jgi:tetratricopeptide (TPR) repeat protein